MQHRHRAGAPCGHAEHGGYQRRGPDIAGCRAVEIDRSERGEDRSDHGRGIDSGDCVGIGLSGEPDATENGKSYQMQEYKWARLRCGSAGEIGDAPQASAQICA